MKLILTISAMILFLITGCESGKQPANDFLTVDITANYPKKELILQDFLDVEYIPLETNEEFITSASMQAIGKNLIILRNKNGQDGDIFIFDRTGKGQRKINRSGQGSQEYTNIGSIALDEEKGELFINNYYSSQFIVYDLSGNFKRTLKYDKTRVRDNILKSKEQKNIQPTKGGHKMVTCQNYVSLFYRQITSCPSDGGIS